MQKRQKTDIMFTLCAVFLCIACLSSVISHRMESEAAFSTGNPEIKLPIVMYHSILNSRSNKYIVSPALLESDFKYLYDNGFNTVTVNDVIDYVNKGTALPANPIMITFDDGHLNNLTYALPLLQKYGMKAVIAIVGNYTEGEQNLLDRNPNYSYLNWQEINDLIDSGRIEIQNHSYNMHNNTSARKGADICSGESIEQYEKLLRDDITKFINALQENTGEVAAAFVYPFGYYSKTSEEILKKEGLLASLTCREKINIITNNPDCLFAMGRFNRAPGESSESFFGGIFEGL